MTKILVRNGVQCYKMQEGIKEGHLVGLEESGKASPKSSTCVGTSRIIRNVLGYVVVNNKLNSKYFRKKT